MAKVTMSRFFRSLGFPLRNDRWSWGAHTSAGVLLRTWDDERADAGRFVRVLGPSNGPPIRDSAGRREREDHLRLLWMGGIAGYVVMAKAVDPTVRPRTIESYDQTAVQAVVALSSAVDGTVWAELGEIVSASKLAAHAVKHRVRPSSSVFPYQARARIAVDRQAAGYVAKLPGMREWLIQVARRGDTVSYAEARAPFGLRPFEHRHAMDRLGHDCLDRGEPILTSLIVDELTRRCSGGFEKEFRRDDLQERENCYAFWRGDAVDPQEELRERTRKFSLAEQRPEQRAFRERVFVACKGKCVITGCDILEVLDAAHREGRDWRQGHNCGSDGWLLRKDIHALYDANLLEISEDGRAHFDPRVARYYSRVLGG